jgi:isopentenyl-diphosphate Delta-isomerase
MNLESEENLDILDDEGNRTGESLPRPIIHDRELIHGSVFIWIYNSKGEVLLQLRAEDRKIFPGLWDVSVAGHIEAGSGPLASAVKEIHEEIGVDIEQHELKQVAFVFDDPLLSSGKRHPIFCWVYILHKEFDIDELEIQAAELTNVKLQSIDDIEAARLKSGNENIYAARNPEIYNLAFNEIKRILS